MTAIDIKIEKWKNKLLDLGKRNRLINYKETTRTTLAILEPGIFELFDQLVNQERKLAFPRPMQEIDLEDDEVEEQISLFEGEFKTSKSIGEQQKTLATLRNKSKLSKEEQGTNILYLSFGFLKWKESEHSQQIITSPLVLVPVNLTLESLTSPFVLQLGEDDIVVNPTLVYKLENDFGLKMPKFEVEEDNLQEYLNKIIEIVKLNQWEVVQEVSLGLLSFLKINMYKDIDNNRDKIMMNSVAMALSGNADSTIHVPTEYNGYNHDKNIRAVDTFQVVDADASQQDAILYAKKGVSFVLQGPPGTGKSQTITNIISESLADGKKVLFVSEKMAALEVVYKRLESVGLSDFCLTLHSHKANKKAVLEELGRTLNINRVKLQEEALFKLELLEKEREELNQYSLDIHTKCLPLNKTIYEVNGLLAKLAQTSNIIFDIADVRAISSNQLNRYKYALEKFARTIENMSADFSMNPWKDCQVEYVTNELRHNVETNLKSILPQLKEVYDIYVNVLKNIQLNGVAISVKGIIDTLDILQIAKESPIVPSNWLNEEDIEELAQEIVYFNGLQKEYSEQKQIIEQEYDNGIFQVGIKEKKEILEDKIDKVKGFLNAEVYYANQHIAGNLHNIKHKVEEWISIYNWLNHKGQIIAETVGLSRENLTIKQINESSELLNLLYKEICPTGLWYESGGIDQVKHIYVEAKEKHSLLKKILTEIEELYESKVIDIDYEQMIMRFKTEYTSVFKIFNKDYKRDKNVLRLNRKEITKKISDTEAISILMKGSKVHDIKKELEVKMGAFNESLGKYYDGMNTKWDVIEEAINHFEKIKGWFDTANINKEVRKIITEGKSVLPPYEYYTEVIKVLEAEKNIYIEELFNNTKSEVSLEVEQIRIFLEERLIQIESALNFYNEIKSYGIEEYNYEKITSDLNRIIRMQDIENIIQNKGDVLKSKYAFLYQGMSTDWE